MRFGAILAFVQGWSNQGWKYTLFQLSPNCILKVDLGTHLADKEGNLFLWDLELFLPLFKVGQTKVENIHFFQLSQNWNFKVDLNTHLWDKYQHLFLWDWSYFFPHSRLVKPRLKICTFVYFIETALWKWI